MSKEINRAGAWERFCRSIYQKVDLFMEARQARKYCRIQLKTVKGGYQNSLELYESTVLPFWSKYGIKPKKK